jgi:glycerophosphoryl diester phosphodiesterase
VSERGFSQEAIAWVVAHRGASASEAENTLEAFEAAIDAGADAVEFDVRMTADGRAVVIHDPDVSRTTDGSGLVKDMTLAQLKRLRIAGSRGRVQIPTLAETLDCLSGRAVADIEIKNIPGEPDFEADRELAAEAAIGAVEGFDGEALLSSFNPSAIKRVLDLDPGATTGLLVPPGADPLAAIAFAAEQGHAWVLPESSALTAAGSAYIERAHEAELRVGTWVVDDVGIALDLMRAGVDAVATNDPGPLVRARERELRGR